MHKISSRPKKLGQLWTMTGNSPLISIRYRHNGDEHTIYAKCLGAIRTQQQLQNKSVPNSVVVTVLPDSNKKYLSTDLLKKEPVKEGFLTPEIELLEYTPLQRLYEN